MGRLESYLKKFDDMPRAFRKRKYLFVLAMVSIAVIHFAVFYVGVNINSILLAFKKFQGYDEKYNEIFVFGFGNFSDMFREFSAPNSDIGIAVRNTLLYFSASLLVIIPVSYFVSYFLHKRIRGFKFFRVVFFLPSIISAVVYVTIFKNIISTFGPLYQFLKLFNYEMPPLLTNPKTATWTIVFYTVWTGIGINMILYQSAMSRLPKEVLESAAIDGASWFREFMMIITPMIWPTLSITIILTVTALFNSSGPILLFSEAGTIAGANNTTTISFFIFQKTWSGNALEYPAAIGIFFTVVSIPIVIAIRFILGRFDKGVEY